jgi:transposase
MTESDDEEGETEDRRGPEGEDRLEMYREQSTVADLAQRYQVHFNRVYARQRTDDAALQRECKRRCRGADPTHSRGANALKSGQVTAEGDFLSKVLTEGRLTAFGCSAACRRAQHGPANQKRSPYWALSSYGKCCKGNFPIKRKTRLDRIWASSRTCDGGCTSQSSKKGMAEVRRCWAHQLSRGPNC